MVKRDYVPTNQLKVASWLESIAGELSAPDYAWAADQAQEIRNLAQEVREATDQMVAARSEYRAAVARKKQVIGQAIQRVRRAFTRLKGSPDYTPATGRALGIQSNLSRQNQAETAAPALKVKKVMHGQVEFGFVKGLNTGILLRCRRGGEADFTEVIRGYRSPVTDSRPNQTDAPETREYDAVYFLEQQVVSSPSNIVVVTVPAERV